MTNFCTEYLNSSTRYFTLGDLVVHTVISKCNLCEKSDTAHFDQETNHRMISKNICFTCDFWNEKVLWSMNPDMIHAAVRINGKHYLIIPESVSSPFLGCGGQEFKIQFIHDKFIVTTRNLWQQGDIPAHFRHLLPDNAIFVNDRISPSVN